MSSEGPAVGVPDVDGSRPPAEAIVSAVESSGCRALVDAPEHLAEADVGVIVAPGDAVLERLASAEPDAPVLPIALDPGIQSVGADDLDAALEAVCRNVTDGTLALARHPLVDVQVDGTTVGRALRDVTVLTAEPARISEFAVECDATGQVDEIRADGVVVATPAGSHGYAAAADGPVLAPGTGIAVVPIAPFRTERTRWIVPPDGLSITVRRDETPVTVEADGRAIREIDKRSYCHQCEFFAEPPEFRCTNEGTEILELTRLDTVRVANCPVILEDERIERTR